jgi:two-component system sensor histidine kinase HydH
MQGKGSPAVGSTDEKVKPFRLVKYFTLISLVVIFLGTIALSLLNTQWVRNLQQKKSEEYARLLIENLNHQVFLQFIIPVGLIYGKIQLRDKEQFARMDKIVRSTLHSFKVDRVNIYDMNDTVSYSFDLDLIGEKDVGGEAYRQALKGVTTYRLVQKGNWLELLLGLPRDSHLMTVAPLRAEKPLSRISGPVLGVVEIYQDLSEEHRTIFKVQIFIIATSTVVMGLLFLILLLVVNRGENIIHARALERLKLEEQLNRARHLSTLGEMVAAVSHEIRNPLGIIRSSAELLKKKVEDDSASRPFADVIVEEATRLNRIITDFLSFARPKTPNRAPCHVNAIIDKNIQFLDAQLKEKGYLVQKRFDESVPEMMADADMLYQAFLNILINAMQSMPEGGTVEIQTRWVPADGLIKLSFNDGGTGIPEDLFSKVWDPFFTTKEKGTGLGLGIVKNIVASHGGRVSVGNRVEGGTRVDLELPVHQTR